MLSWTNFVFLFLISCVPHCLTYYYFSWWTCVVISSFAIAVQCSSSQLAARSIRVLWLDWKSSESATVTTSCSCFCLRIAACLSTPWPAGGLFWPAAWPPQLWPFPRPKPVVQSLVKCRTCFVLVGGRIMLHGLVLSSFEFFRVCSQLNECEFTILLRVNDVAKIFSHHHRF